MESSKIKDNIKTATDGIPYLSIIVAILSFLIGVLLPFLLDSFTVNVYFFSTLFLCSSVYYTSSSLATYFHFDGSGRQNAEQSYVFYDKLQKKENDSPERCSQGVEMTTKYYDIVTDWYEKGWGQSFQLGSAQGFKGESFAERCRRHDYWVANRANIKKGEVWLDIGCGIGGPLRNIVRFTEANVIGVNFNQYQISRARMHLEREGLEKYGSFVFCDMNKITTIFDKNSKDGIYACESICHSPDKVHCYKELLEVLKPGGTFACVEWVLTDKYDDTNPSHIQCKRDIEILGGIPALITAAKTLKSIKEAGFEIEVVEDMSFQTTLFPDPWYDKFDPGFSLLKWPISKTGIACLQYFLKLSEKLSMVPPGTAIAHKTITSGIPGTGLSGKLGIFTPHMFIKCRKPITRCAESIE